MTKPLRSLAVVFILSAAALFVTTPAWAAAKVEQVTSPGGITAWLVVDRLNPIISMRFSFKGGAALDPVGKEGLANLASSVLDEGAGDLDSKAFQQSLEDNAITLRFSASRDAFGGRVRTLTENRDLAFDLLRQAITSPRFDEEPVERLRSQILVGLRQDETDPRAVASKTMLKSLFPDHVYGRPTEGSLESVTGLNADDLRTFVAERLAKSNLIIGVVGDISADELGPLLDSTFGALPEKPTGSDVPAVTPISTGEITVVDKNIPQSSILFADAGMMRDDPDFYAAFVMNHMLGGGGFSSRLYTEVREKRGLAYSVYSYLQPLDHAALFLGGAGTANERAGETVQVVKDEIKRMAENGVSAEELQAAKDFLIGSYPLRFTSSGRIAGMLVGMQRDNLGVEYLEKRNGYIDAVTEDDIKRVAAKLLNSERLTFVVVGKPEGLPATN